MDDRDRIVRLLGQVVAMQLTTVEAWSVEIMATLDDGRGGGIVHPEIGELGSGRRTPETALELPVLYLIPPLPRLAVVRRSPGSGSTKSRARTTIRMRLAATLTNASAKATR